MAGSPKRAEQLKVTKVVQGKTCNLLIYSTESVVATEIEDAAPPPHHLNWFEQQSPACAGTRHQMTSDIRGRLAMIHLE